jgi:nitrate/nitrite transporter NarK
LPFTTSFTGFAVIVSCYGLGLGCWYLLIPVLLREHHGTEAIASSYGLARLFQGMVTLVIPPFIGFIKDTTDDYVIGFYFMGACMILGGIVINFVPCVQRYLIERDAAKRANNF